MVNNKGELEDHEGNAIVDKKGKPVKATEQQKTAAKEGEPVVVTKDQVKVAEEQILQASEAIKKEEEEGDQTKQTDAARQPGQI